MMPVSMNAQVSASQPVVEQHQEVPDAISADRPGFGFSTDIASPGVRQMESGIGYGVTTQAGVRQRAFTYGSPLLRLGIQKNFEVRLGGPNFNLQQSDFSGTTHTQQGWSDFGIGSKLRC